MIFTPSFALLDFKSDLKHRNIKNLPATHMLKTLDSLWPAFLFAFFVHFQPPLRSQTVTVPINLLFK